MILRLSNPRFRSAILFIDYDWTLVCPKDGHTFPKDVADWKWLRPTVPDIVRAYYAKGFGICVVTNQSKPWKHEQIVQAMTVLDIPVTVCIATDKSIYKPSLAVLHEAFTPQQLYKINKTKSFFCGDALGRPNDHSDCDREFAKAFGIRWVSPEDLFPVPGSAVPEPSILGGMIPAKTQEIIVLVGPPGSGKTTLCSQVFEPAGYVIAHGDEWITSAKMIRFARPHLINGKSVVFDATHASQKKRAEFIELAKHAKSQPIPIRCILMALPMEDAMARNNQREKPVPRIVYSVYKKNYEMPTVAEGFTEVISV